MKILNRITLFFRKIFHKKNIKMLEECNEILYKKNTNFLDSLKVEIEEKKNNKIETLICEGDGLGIKKKISY